MHTIYEAEGNRSIVCLSVASSLALAVRNTVNSSLTCHNFSCSATEYDLRDERCSLL